MYCYKYSNINGLQAASVRRKSRQQLRSGAGLKRSRGKMSERRLLQKVLWPTMSCSRRYRRFSRARKGSGSLPSGKHSRTLKRRHRNKAERQEHPQGCSCLLFLKEWLFVLLPLGFVGLPPGGERRVFRGKGRGDVRGFYCRYNFGVGGKGRKFCD